MKKAEVFVQYFILICAVCFCFLEKTIVLCCHFSSIPVFFPNYLIFSFYVLSSPLLSPFPYLTHTPIYILSAFLPQAQFYLLFLVKCTGGVPILKEKGEEKKKPQVLVRLMKVFSHTTENTLQIYTKMPIICFRYLS